MLATKLLPEMEEQERALLAGLGCADPTAGGAASGGDGPLAGLPLAEQFAWVADQERELNHLIDALTREQASLLGANSERRRELQAAVAKATPLPAAAPAAPPPQPCQRGQQPPVDPLLAAVTYGAGLT